MIPTEVPEILLTELYLPVHRAKHSEEGRKFDVYVNSKTHDLLLVDIFLFDRQLMIVPAHFQRDDLTNTFWEHFKSTSEHPMTYLVHGLGIDLEDLEQKYVIYSPQYESGKQSMKEQRVTCLARPEEMFFSGVNRDGYSGPRFRRIG